MNKTYYISTAIAYASGKPHIGNTYEVIMADAIARFKKKQGYDVYFQTGTDEHGQKIAEKAEQAGLTPQAFVDKISAEVETVYKSVNASYDLFARTTDPVHKDKVGKIYTKLYESGLIYKDLYKGLYCTPCESFFTEAQLVNGNCPDCSREVHYEEEEALFLDMPKFQKKLTDYINEHPNFLIPESRKNEMFKNFIEPGLRELCVSRTSFDWGVPIPFAKGHVSYVWIDALANYITFLGYDPDGNHSDNFKKYWPADLHLVGKDIFRFHAIYWPIVLMGLDLELPKQILGHPWIIMSDGKMSKSKGNLLYADELAAKYGVDRVRYYVLKETPYANDGIISEDLIIERTNTDLANTYGNLVNRTISMTNKYFNGEVRAPLVKESVDDELINLSLQTKDEVTKLIEEYKMSDALEAVQVLLRRANRYVDETTPWILGKDESKYDRLSTVLYNLLEVVRFSTVLLEAFIPETASKVYEFLNTDNTSLDSLNEFNGTKIGTYLNKSEILFERLELKAD